MFPLCEVLVYTCLQPWCVAASLLLLSKVTSVSGDPLHLPPQQLGQLADAATRGGGGVRDGTVHATGVHCT